MSEVKYEDEKKLLTSDEFIAAAKQNADKNLQIQKDTAQKVYDSTYASLDRQYNEAAAAAGVAKERNLIDADTAYQRQEMKYGAEQEALAAAGLSGSGMNEYRRAQSYQKNREDRQMSYAEYDRALREANYTRDQGKLAADLNKVQSDAAAEMHYNDTMTGIAEKELGYAELERQEIDTAYSGYLAGIEDGSLTMDQIMADSSWAKLSPEQQASVEKTAKIKGIKTKIDNGDKWENVQNSYAYLELDEDGRNQIDAYHAEVEAGKTKDANAASGNYLEMAMKGMSIDSIVALAKANGHYQTLVDSGFWNAVTAEAERIANEQSAAKLESDYNTALGLLADGWTIDEIKAHLGTDAVKALTDSGKFAQIGNASNVMERIKKDTEGKTAQESLLTYLDLAASGNYTLDQLVAIATSLGHYDTLSKLDKDGNETGLWAQVVSKFEQTAQDNKNTETVTNINNAIANGATLDDIQKMPGYDELDDNVKEEIGEQVTERDEAAEVEVDAVVTEMVMQGAMNTQDINDYLAVSKVPESMRAEIISKYQGEMASRTIASINDGSAFNGENALTGAALVENIKNGVYGDKGKDVAVSYFTKRVKEIKGNDILFIASVIYDIDDLSGYLEPTHEARLNSAIDSAIKSIPSTQFTIDNATFNTVTINGEPYKTSSKVADKNVASLLESFREEKSKQIIGVGDSRYLYKDGEWYELEIDKTRPGSIKPSDITNAKVTGTAEYKADRINGDRWILDGKEVLWHKISNPAQELLQRKFADKPTGFYIEINGRKYMNYGSGEWRLIYTK